MSKNIALWEGLAPGVFATSDNRCRSGWLADSCWQCGARGRRQQRQRLHRLRRDEGLRQRSYCPWRLGGVIGLAKTVIARSIEEPLKIRAKKAALAVAVQFWTVLPRGAASPALSN